MKPVPVHSLSRRFLTCRDVGDPRRFRSAHAAVALCCAIALIPVRAIGQAAGATNTGATSAANAQPAPPTGTLSGDVAVGAVGADRGVDGSAQTALAVNLSGKLSANTQATIAIERGPRQDVSTLFQDSFYQSRVRVMMRNPRWSVSLGELTPSSGALTGPGIRANGAAFTWRGSRLVVDGMVGRPAALGQTPGGHLARGSVGIRTTFGVIGVAVSDLLRPTLIPVTMPGLVSLNTAGQALAETISTQGAAAVEDLQNDDVERIVKLFSASNRVRGVGVQSDLKLAGGTQRLEIRAGSLHLTNAYGLEQSGASAEVRHTLSATRGSLTTVVRQMPSAVPGISLPGDEMSTRGTFALNDAFSVMGSAYHLSSSTLGGQRTSRTDMFTATAGYAHARWRFDMRARQRESHFGRTRITRTVTADWSIDVRRLTIDATAETGDETDGRSTRRIEAYGGAVEWRHPRGAVSIAANVDNDALALRTVEASTGLRLGRAEWHAGGMATSDALFGRESRIWTALSFPVMMRFRVVAGVENRRWDYAGAVWQEGLSDEMPAGPWRATLSVQRKLALPVPFLHARPAGEPLR